MQLAQRACKLLLPNYEKQFTGFFCFPTKFGTNDLDKCEVLSVTAFDKTLNAHLCLDGQPFSKLNKLANSLNRLRLDCGDSAFGAFVTAGKTAAFRSADSAVTVIENIRNGYALRETQDMDFRM